MICVFMGIKIPSSTPDQSIPMVWVVVPLMKEKPGDHVTQSLIDAPMLEPLRSFSLQRSAEGCRQSLSPGGDAPVVLTGAVFSPDSP